MIKIEKNMPIPPVKPSGKRVYPTDTMDVNESFSVPCKDIKDARRRRGTIYSSAYHIKHTGKRFKIMIIQEGADIIVRCWRTC